MDRSFCYEPLDDAENCIRLLRILPPTNGSDTIYCSLVTTRLDKKPSYEALSYVWGSQPSSATIQCDGKAVSITSTLYQALRSLQRLGDLTDRLFWIDALCINQNDSAEKSSQVRLMHHIYRTARNVILWPGEPASDGHRYGEPVNKSMRSMVEVGGDGRHNHKRGLHGSILRYLEAPIFRRVWVLQEILSSRKTSLLLEDGETEWETFWSQAAIETITSNVVRGDRSLPLASMAAFEFYTTKSSINLIASSSDLLAAYGNTYDRTRESGSANELAGLWAWWAKMLDLTARLDTTDPRDRVFALVGIADTLGIIVPKPDYSKSTRLVFQETLSMLRTRRENNLSLFQPFATALQHSRQALGLDLLVKAGSDEFKKDIAGKWQWPSKHSLSPQTGETAYDEGLELSYHGFFDNILQHHKQLLCKVIFHYLAGKFPHAPFSFLGDSDSTRTTEDQHIPGPQLPKVSGRAAAANPKSVAKRKRRGGPSRCGEDDDEDDEEGGDERQQKKSKETVDPWKRLACPYFQRDGECPRLRAVCRGPGFETTARLKEHLYRVHHIHPCLRCGKIFESREAVSQHSQLIQPCNAVQWRQTFNPSQGFEDLQKEKLGKKTVRTWQQIFGILFPRDDPASYPPQYYSNTDFVRILDQFHQHFLLESTRILPQRLANDSSTINSLLQGQRTQFEAYALQLVNDIFSQIIGNFRAGLVRAPSDHDVRELAIHTRDPGLHVMQAALSASHDEESTLQAGVQSVPQLGGFGSVLTPSVAFEQYLTRFAPAGTFDNPPFNFGAPQSADDGREEHDWQWEFLGMGSG